MSFSDAGKQATWNSEEMFITRKPENIPASFSSTASP